MDEKKPMTLGGQLSSGNKYELMKNLPGVPSINGIGAGDKNDKKQSSQEVIDEIEKLKKKLEGFKKNLLKKYKFTRSLSILPAQASKIIEEDEGIPKEISDTKPLYVLMIIPEEQYKNIPKIKPEIVKIVKDSGENIWAIIKTEVDLWHAGLDSKFDVLDIVSASFPLHDNGFLGALRVANIHKSLVLRKFEKYVSTYIIGGSLVRGTVDKTSDLDTVVIIDDTDVKRMPRLELLEKLRGIIYDYVSEAIALAGVKNNLHVQVWLLTDFWQRVKDAEPVAFTFIRDGIPLYDRGTFIPWKLLLQMGKIKPSSEAIDAYMKQGDQTEPLMKRRLIDAMIDLYYGVVTPTQAMMMLAGEAPPVPKEIIGEVKKVLVEREKIMSLKDLKTLERLVKMFKAYEHGKLNEVSGKEIDELYTEWKDYHKMLKEMRKKLEKQMQEKNAEEVYGDVFKLLKVVLGNRSQNELVKEFGKRMVGEGKIQPRFLRVLEELVKVKNKIKSGKLNQKEVDAVKKDAIEFMERLTEYQQRIELTNAKKQIMQVKGNDRNAELVLLGKKNFVIEEGMIRKIEKGKLVNSNKEEFEKELKESESNLKREVSGEVFSVLRKEFGDFELVF